MAGKRILLTGVSGQVGYELYYMLQHIGEVIPSFPSMEENWLSQGVIMDLCDSDSIAKTIRELRPDLIVNPAAYTAVDKAEDEEELALRINGDAPSIISEEAKKIGASVIHFSTDYVYGRMDETQIVENDPANPLNAYGRSKLAGDSAVVSSGAAYIILRTSWIYGIYGNNFVKTMIKLGRKNESLSIVGDQIGAPTSARSLAMAVSLILSKSGSDPSAIVREKGGIYHAASSGETSWFGFAEEIFRQAAKIDSSIIVKNVKAIPTEEYKSKAKRAKNSRLSCKKFRDAFHLEFPSWQTSLSESLPIIVKNTLIP
ncbi:MAG: dTDP-4-dehydrorhamnose reductase [Oligoflexales bacterium]|nr:dTDP-4-dehydrorhamnose reductase [Oligoflexales bacterium]